MAGKQSFINIRSYSFLVVHLIKLSAEIEVKIFITSVRNYLHIILFRNSLASK